MDEGQNAKLDQLISKSYLILEKLLELHPLSKEDIGEIHNKKTDHREFNGVSEAIEVVNLEDADSSDIDIIKRHLSKVAVNAGTHYERLVGVINNQHRISPVPDPYHKRM